MKVLIILLLIVLAGFSSCREDPVEVIYASFGKSRGVFISCEGNYMYGNASLSYYDMDMKRVYNQVFFARNRAPLGDVAQSMASDGKHLFVVVNNSGKIVALDLNTVEYKGSLKGLVSPRYIHLVSGEKAYVSDLYAQGITVFHPVTLEQSGFIPLPGGKSPGGSHPSEFFVQVGPYVYVSCWSYDNIIMVINSETDQVIDSIEVPRQPGKMVVDRNNKIWVITDGDYAGGTTGYDRPSLVRIDPETRTVEQVMGWELSAHFPRDIGINPTGDSLYIIAGDLYKMAASERKLSGQPLVKAGEGIFYSLGVDPVSGDIFIGDAIDFSQNGLIYRYTASGIPVDSFRVGINPGDYLFQ